MPNTNQEDVPKGIEGIVEKFKNEVIWETTYEEGLLLGYDNAVNWLRTELLTLHAELIARVEGKRTIPEHSSECINTEYPEHCDCDNYVRYNQAIDDTKAIINSVFKIWEYEISIIDNDWGTGWLFSW